MMISAIDDDIYYIEKSPSGIPDSFCTYRFFCFFCISYIRLISCVKSIQNYLVPAFSFASFTQNPIWKAYKTASSRLFHSLLLHRFRSEKHTNSLVPAFSFASSAQISIWKAYKTASSRLFHSLLLTWKAERDFGRVLSVRFIFPAFFGKWQMNPRPDCAMITDRKSRASYWKQALWRNLRNR